jgi:hypothetical protein
MFIASQPVLRELVLSNFSSPCFEVKTVENYGYWTG